MTAHVDVVLARVHSTLTLIDRVGAAIPPAVAAALRHSLGGALVPPSAVSVLPADTLNGDVLGDVAIERKAQDRKWGEQNHPDGTGTVGAYALAELLRIEVDTAAAAGGSTWAGILAEEVAEAYAETDPEALRVELVQVAAVAVQWCAAIDRRDFHGGPR